MQVGETTLWSKEVQRLLWAVGEARARASRREPPKPAARRPLANPPEAATQAGFFTEWQPTAV
jgi:hypothetical protein